MTIKRCGVCLVSGSGSTWIKGFFEFSLVRVKYRKLLGKHGSHLRQLNWVAFQIINISYIDAGYCVIEYWVVVQFRLWLGLNSGLEKV
jgi:hypothetical protein